MRAVASRALDAMGTEAAREIAMLSAEAFPAASALMRGSGDDLEACIALEGRILNERLQGPEAKAAFEAFFAR